MVPGRGAADAEQIADAAGATCDHTLSRLYELQALGFVERQDGRWQLVRTATDESARHAG